MGKIITNVKVYDLEESMVASGYAMINEYDSQEAEAQANTIITDNLDGNKHYKRVIALTKAPLNSGHVSWAKGVVVNMDITFTNKEFIELQRYHFIDIVTGMSTMHRIAKFNLDHVFNEYVDPHIIIHLKAIQKEYINNPTPENYLRLLYSTPSGILMTGRVTTNYLQLMNIYSQRHNHRLPNWRNFCQELIDELPLFKELLIANGILKEEE